MTAYLTWLGHGARLAGAAGVVALLALVACGPRPVTSSTLGTSTVTILSNSTSLPMQPPMTAAAASTSTSTPASSGVHSSTSAARPAVTVTPTAAKQATVNLYFTRGSKLVTEARSVPATDPMRSSLEELLAGPMASGNFSEVPKGTRLLGVSLTGNTASVNLSSQVQSLQGAPAIPLFLGQVVNTVTQFQGVERVSLQVEGHPVRTLGGEGVAVPEPLDRAAVERLLAQSGS